MLEPKLALGLELELLQVRFLQPRLLEFEELVLVRQELELELMKLGPLSFLVSMVQRKGLEGGQYLMA